MEELKKFVNQNRLLVWCGLGALMFIFVAFCDVVTIGKGIGAESFNGFKVLFGIKESAMGVSAEASLGFSRILVLLMILVPICLIVVGTEKVKISALDSVKDKLPLILCGACAVLAILYMISLGKADITLSAGGQSENMGSTETALGFGVYLYLVLGLAGAAVAYLTNKK